MAHVGENLLSKLRDGVLTINPEITSALFATVDAVRFMLGQFTSQSADSAFLATSQRLNLISTELQGSVMKTRMQPIGNVWSKLPRAVRANAPGRRLVRFGKSWRMVFSSDERLVYLDFRADREKPIEESL